ncbi:condensation domain-containing protein, partial [Paenibacillus lentus]|uniref:condensation domain-containing protein n=1 Tax=Paenibacillus lentus TaxID=1338368 RepID=UPI00364CDDAA
MGSGTEIQKIYPLSPMQSGMLFHSIVDRDSHAYFEQMILKLQGELDLDKFTQSFQKLIERHDILRTIFVYEKVKKPLQIVLKERKAQVYFETLVSLHPQERTAKVERFIREDKEKGFDITADLLMRISILQTSQAEYTVVWSHHHILMDGWCMSLLLEDFFEIYQSLRSGSLVHLPPAPSYNRFIEWIGKQDEAQAASFWRSYVDDFSQMTPLVKASLPSSRAYEHSVHICDIDVKLSRTLSEMAGTCNVTLNSVIQAAWGLLLQRYNYTQDAVFGSVVSGRPPELPDVESIVGLFINTVPVRLTSDSDDTFARTVAAFQESILQTRSYDYYPLYEIQSDSSLKEGLFDHIIAFENFPVSAEVESKSNDKWLGFTVEAESESFEQTNYDFNLIVIPGEHLRLKVLYNEEAIAVERVRQILQHYIHILEQVAARPEMRLSEIEVATPTERQQLAFDFNATEKEYSRNLCLHEPFERQAEQHPNRVALCMDGQEMTYGELNRRANQLAHHLQH